MDLLYIKIWLWLHVTDMLKSTTLTLCDYTIVTISVRPLSELEDCTKVGWRILTRMYQGHRREDEYTKLTGPSGTWPRPSSNCIVFVPFWSSCDHYPRIDDVRPYLNIRRWKRTNHGADHAWPVRVKLRAQRAAHIEPDLRWLRQGRIKTVE